jgi:peptide/nickel transport system substrate-binding protein
VDDVEQGTSDYAWMRPVAMSPHVTRLVARYGVNGQRFFVTPGRGLSMLVLNASRPLFRNNANFRRAVNFAIDRKALVREAGTRFSTPADQYLQPHQLAYRDARVYPFTPNLSKARELARGNRRGGKLVFYTRDEPLGYAYGAIVRANLAKIGLDVKVKAFPSVVTFDLLPKRGEPFDIGWIAGNNSPPNDLSLHAFFDGRTLDDPVHFNWSHFNSPRVNRRLDEAARLRGPSFYRAYGELDVELARDFAPAVTFAYMNELTLVSARTGCVVNTPFFDLAAACIR